MSIDAATETIGGDRLYYEAENLGFTQVIEEDIAGLYEFDSVLVVKAPDGTMWAAHDSGCSCPTPFEDQAWPADWVPIREPGDINALVNDWGGDDHGSDAARVRVKAAVVAAFN